MKVDPNSPRIMWRTDKQTVNKLDSLKALMEKRERTKVSRQFFLTRCMLAGMTVMERDLKD
jgi:hypothetical protein